MRQLNIDYVKEYLQLAFEQLLYEKEEAVANQEFTKVARMRDTGDLIKKALRLLETTDMPAK